jgi:hypothetical protein
MNDRDTVRRSLWEVRNELQTLSGEMDNLVTDYDDQFDVDMIYHAAQAVTVAMNTVHAALLQFEEVNLEA